MELLDFSKIYTMDLLRENIENLKNEGYLDAGTAGCIQKKEIMEFLNTNVGKRMQNGSQGKNTLPRAAVCSRCRCKRILSGLEKG